MTAGSPDRIELRGLRVRGRHGVYPQEREEGQEFVVDVSLFVDTADAAATDDLARTPDYGEMARRIAAVVSGEPVDLLETLAERIAAVCLADPRVSGCAVNVHKPHAPIPLAFDDVVVAVQRSRPIRAVLALGANLGDPAATLQHALDALALAVRVVAVSPVYETDPVGGPPQPAYLNAVAIVETTLSPRRLLTLVQVIEQAAGRIRTVRWGPRTLDIDVICYGDLVSRDPELTLPHPRAAERGFVLVPWHDVDPDAVLPGHGTIAELLTGLDLRGIRRREDVVLAVGREAS
ncbi:MAG: 2-amino-4-hydroxy-6-hydroxymethyldihydropteridine diphosphokinase [Acidothermus sp.]|nr:2-amino-4-hydroxy-6-hydroxymethyldihydropteridine diphosphokinase [Acidothermus sp.]MCL6537707.1 2-amino-4-hydroxy-6-hydroxymethyldihydropteridine diphosphokinase [Acidothermus sp.]